MEDIKRSRTNEQVSRENRWNEPEQTRWLRNTVIRSIDCRFVRLPIVIIDNNELNDISLYVATYITADH